MPWSGEGWVPKTAAVAPPSTFGFIANFSGANGASYSIDGIQCQNDNPNKAWSMVKLSDYSLRHEVRSGDQWQDGTERDECSFFNTRYAAGVKINLFDNFIVQPGPVNSAGFFAFHQLHAGTNSPPAPYYLNFDAGDRISVIIQNPGSNFTRVGQTASPIVRGQLYAIRSEVWMAPGGGGYAKVWIDGVQLANYSGAIGASNFSSDYYWKVGIYRNPATETAIVDHSNIHMTTG